jgi:hypothetical protein
VCLAVSGLALTLVGAALITFADLDHLRQSEVDAVMSSVSDWDHTYQQTWLGAQV